MRSYWITALTVALIGQNSAMAAEAHKQLATSPTALASTSEPSRAELARRVGILTDEVQRLKERLVLPEEEEMKSSFGLGPAASRVYRTRHGLSIGGYGEFSFQFKGKDADKGEDFSVGDLLRYVQYIGYKFTDKLLVNAEIEIEHATTEENYDDASGAVSVEFAALEYLAHPAISLRAGLLLIPMGFINEVHEPPFFHGSLRPEVEQRIIPATWSALGAGLFGEPLPGLSYKLYVVDGLNAEKFEDTGWREGRQGGGRALVEDFACVLNLTYQWRSMLLVGGSVYYGGADQDLLGDVSVRTLLVSGRAQLRYRGLELRVLGAYGALNHAAALTRAIYPDPTVSGETENRLVGSSVYGWYAEVAYDLWPLWSANGLYLAPFFRFEQYDTQATVPTVAGRQADPDTKRRVIEGGVTFKPHPQVVVKLSYRDTDGSGSGDFPDSVLVGAGFVY